MKKPLATALAAIALVAAGSLVSLAEETATPSAGADDAEEFAGLPPGPGRETVYGICSACHSLMIVKQQGLTRSVWDETLDWMVEEQGMPELGPEEREKVLDYLAEHYGPDSRTPQM